MTDTLNPDAQSLTDIEQQHERYKQEREKVQNEIDKHIEPAEISEPEPTNKQEAWVAYKRIKRENNIVMRKAYKDNAHPNLLVMLEEACSTRERTAYEVFRKFERQT